jgi:hypothetical protein
VELPQRETYEVLNRKGVRELHHVNSVLTSCNFLKEGALLSRWTVAQRGLKQTKQRSDEADKEAGVDRDVFVDSLDLHEAAGNRCWYGAVMFVLDLEILLDENTGGIWVSKVNAEKFKKIDPSLWCFNDLEELQHGFVSTKFDHQIVLRGCDGELSFDRYLKRIVLDDPEVEGYCHFDDARRSLESAMAKSGLDVRVDKRLCKDCGCREHYAAKPGFVRKMFTLDTNQLATAWD